MKFSLEEVRRVFHQDKNEIIKKYSASGASIGKEGEDFVIVIYLNTEIEKPNKLYWKNIPLSIRYSGNIKKQ